MGSEGSMNDRGRERLDVLLVEKGFFVTREKARRAIMAGEVIISRG
jgi:23S rRNA (cytidine1920-2'-O)/16S rRNA (cytidine1409-2'-O)-methyltransferase